MSERKRQCCSNCDHHGNNLVAMGCGHRLCINCIKNVRIPASNCIVCLSSRSKKNRTSVSPEDKRQQFQQPKTLREKILDRVRSPSTAHQISESSPDKSNRTYNPDSQSKTPVRGEAEVRMEVLQCREHSQPLIMYCERTKEFYCAQCLYLKNARNLNTVPIRNALESLQQENRLNREESRGSLTQVESAIRVCTANRQLFESALRQYHSIIQGQFQELHQLLKKREMEVAAGVENLFQTRIDQYGKVLTDLEFLRTSLREFREHNNKENSSLNAVVYMFSAYKIIRKTVKNIDMNYLQYVPQDLSVIDLDGRQLKEAIASYGRVKLDLPLRPHQTSKPSRVGSLERGKSKPAPYNPMQSIRQQNESSQVNNSIPSRQHRDKPNSSQGRTQTHSGSKSRRPQQAQQPARRKQQHSLCNNIYEPPEKNLYERLLNEKFNRYK